MIVGKNTASTAPLPGKDLNDLKNFNPGEASVKCSKELNKYLTVTIGHVDGYTSLLDAALNSTPDDSGKITLTITEETVNFLKDLHFVVNGVKYQVPESILGLEQNYKPGDKITLQVCRNLNNNIVEYTLMDTQNNPKYTLLINGEIFDLEKDVAGLKLDGGLYDGVTINGNPHGQGTMKWPDDAYYEGEWKDDKMHGQGTMTWPYGTSYTGNWSNGKRSGQGTMTWADGTSYTGNWSNGNRSGQGTMTWADGSRYVGEWKDDKGSGQGTMTWVDGKKYTGNWGSGVQSGQGILTWLDGTSYTGNWENGAQSGQGILTYAENNVIESNQWSRGCLPTDKIPKSNLEQFSATDLIGRARIEFEELMKTARKSPPNNLMIQSAVYPKLQDNPLAYIAAIDPVWFKHDASRRVYGPEMFNSGDPCNFSGSYLNGFFLCAESIAKTKAMNLTLGILKDALSHAFPLDYTKLNLSEAFNPTNAALYYYDLANNTSSIQHLMERGLFYPLESVLPHSNCRYVDFDKISPTFSNEESMNEAFEKYKNYFLIKITEAGRNKNQIKSAIILFVSQIEVTHFFNNGNNRLSCQILLNKLLVEYEVYDDKLGSILFIPNGFSHYALSHLNYYLKDKNKDLDTCTTQDLENALMSAIAWVDFGHECYQNAVISAASPRPKGCQ